MWIKVKDKLPEDELVLVYAPCLDPDMPLITVAWYRKSFGWSLLPKCWCKAITYWMPLPKPPEEK